MSKQSSPAGFVFGMFAAALLSLNASAATTIIYDNSANDLVTRLNPGLLEVGDEVIFATNTSRYLTQFDFEYYGLNSANNFVFAGGAAVQARVKFYLNDGLPYNGYATPGTSFFDSGWFGGFGPTPRNTIVFAESLGDFPVGGLFLPAESITWSVQFRGLGATDEIGVDIYDPPVVGQNINDYWEYNGVTWTLLTGSVPMNFAARFIATDVVPEPASFTLLAVAGLGMLVARRLRRA